jgi:hypothetical protein
MFVGDMVVMSLPVFGFILNVCLVKERTLFRTRTLSIRIFVGIPINITRGWNRGIRVRYAVPKRMRFARLNSAIIGLAISGSKSEIARVKVCPVLPILFSTRPNRVYSQYLRHLSE